MSSISSPPPQPPSNEVATFARLHPKEYHRQFLSHSIRPDGRSLSSVRPVLLVGSSIPSCAGSSLVRIGSSSVVCGIKLEIGRPFDTHPLDGRLVVEVSLGPLCSARFKSGRATETAVALSQWLTNAIVQSGAINLADLSIVSGESAWVIYADIMCINYDGNMYDACLLALMQSLIRLRIPDTEVVDEGSMGGAMNTGGSGASGSSNAGGGADEKSTNNEVFISDTTTRSINVHAKLVSTTFGVLEQQLLADPTQDEEDLMTGQVTIVLNDKSELVQVHKSGGVPLSDDQLLSCIHIAKVRVPLILPMLN